MAVQSREMQLGGRRGGTVFADAANRQDFTVTQTPGLSVETNAETVETAQSHNIRVLLGIATPSEVQHAWSLGGRADHIRRGPQIRRAVVIRRSAALPAGPRTVPNRS